MQMERGLRGDGEAGSLPALGQAADGGCTHSSPPRMLRFNETPRRPSLVGKQQTSNSKLPELARRESIISTYRRELYQPRMVTFMKNGDRYFEGIKVNVSARNFRHWEVLLAELSRSIGLPAGVRNIYTPDGGHRVTALEQFQHQKVYVCASTEPFRRIGYTKVKTPTWHAGTKIKHSTGTLLDLSRSFQSAAAAGAGAGGGAGREQPLFSNSQIDNRSLPNLIPPAKERKRKTGLARKISFSVAQPTAQTAEQTEPSQESVIPQRKKSSSVPHHQPHNPSLSSQFTIICTKPPPMKVVKIFLDRNHLTSWEMARSLINGSLPQSNKLQKLYSVEGVEVESLSQLWATNRVLISAGDDDIMGSTSFLQNIKDSTHNIQEVDGEADREMTSEENKFSVVVNHAAAEEQEESKFGQSTTSQMNDSSLLYKTKDTTEVEQRDSIQYTKHHREIMSSMPSSNGVRNSEEIKEEPKSSETAKELQAMNERELPQNVQKMSISETNLLLDTPPTIQSPISPPGHSKTTTQPQSSNQNTQQSSQEAQRSSQEIQPTNSLLALTEDGSYLGCGSPLTMDRVAAIQHVHRLALQYDIDRMSVSGSECSGNNIHQSLTSKPSVLYPGTPQSNISFSQPRSLVEMIMPQENGFTSGTSVDSASSSSTRQSSLPIKSRTIGIQTDLVGDKISAIIEEDQHPMNLGRSQTKRKTTHPLFHTQTSIVSQLNTNQTRNPKDNYRLGPVVAEGRFAVVRECHHKMTGRQYSLRVINKAGVFGHEDLVLRECELLRGLKHDHLVQMMDWWETSDDLYMVAEHIEGTDLFDAVLHCRHFSEGDAVCVMRQLSTALVYLHAHKIVHRDVKMENIILHQSGESGWSLKLGGMGLAAKATEPLSLVCGNIFYMAPEMIARTGYGTKLDVWAAGVVCCTVLSGVMPFGSNSKRATVANVQKGKYAFLSPFWDEVSDEAKDFVRRMLVVSPNKRYMATQMLQHPWLGRERWKEMENLRDQTRLGQTLMDHLISKASSGKNAALPTLIETALDKRKALPNIDLLKSTPSHSRHIIHNNPRTK